VWNNIEKKFINSHMITVKQARTRLLAWHPEEVKRVDETGKTDWDN
jgi:hypothetical protein